MPVLVSIVLISPITVIYSFPFGFHLNLSALSKNIEALLFVCHFNTRTYRPAKMRATTLYLTKWLLIWLNISFFVANIYVTVRMFQRTDDNFRRQLRRLQPLANTTTTLTTTNIAATTPSTTTTTTTRRPFTPLPVWTPVWLTHRPRVRTTTTTTTTVPPTTIDMHTYRRRRSAETMPTDEDVLAEIARIRSRWSLRQCGVGLISLIVGTLSVLGVIATCQGSNTLLLLYTTLLALSLLILSLSWHNFLAYFWLYVSVLCALAFTLATSLVHIRILKRSPAKIHKRILATYRPSVSI